MMYSTVDAAGKPGGFYSTDGNGKNIPDSAIEISDEDWRAHLDGDFRKWNGEKWVAYKTSPLTAGQLREVYRNRITSALLELDLKRIRPSAEGDSAYLTKLNARAIELRKQLTD